MSLSLASCRYISMMTLTLYAGLMPNIDNGVHLRYTDVDEYIYYINANYAVGEYLPNDNYRLNADILKISLDYFLRNTLDYRKITYIHQAQLIGEGEDAKYIHTFYFVKGCKMQSGYVVFNIALDYWATYQYVLDDLKLVLNRTNAILPNETMVYDEITKVETPFSTDPTSYSLRLSGTGDTRRYLPNYFFYVVFIVEYVAVRNLANTDYVKATDIFAIELGTLIASIGNVGGSYASIDLASMIISGVTATTTNIGGVNNDAKIIGAYLVPYVESRVHLNLSATSVEFEYRTILTGQTKMHFTAYHMYTYRRDIPYYKYLTPTNNVGEGIDYKYYVGSFHSYMQLVNYRKSNGVQFMVSFLFSPSQVKLFVSQGENSKDITNAITIPLIANAETSDVLQHLCYIADGLSMAVNNAKSIMNSKSYGELGLNVADALLDNFKFFKGNVNADMGITQGDALTELRYDHDNCLHPLNIIYFKSLNDEKYNARLLGANVNATIENIDVIDGKTLLGATPQDVTFNDYYIRGHLIGNVAGQEDAFNIIKAKLQNGVYVRFVHDIS